MLENLCVDEGSASGGAAQTDVFSANAGRIRCKDRSAFENVRQLANVAWPLVCVEPVERRCQKILCAEFSSQKCKEMLAQRSDIVEPLAQRRDLDGKTARR